MGFHAISQQLFHFLQNFLIWLILFITANLLFPLQVLVGLSFLFFWLLFVFFENLLSLFLLLLKIFLVAFQLFVFLFFFELLIVAI